MVWVHVGLATATWLVLLWSVAAAGRLVPRRAKVPIAEHENGARELGVIEPVG
jgi:hypothetical protein